MKKYVVKKGIVDGNKVALFGKKVIALPEEKLKSGCVAIVGSDEMIVEPGTKALTYRVFEDKFGRGSYRLGYIEWQPTATVL